MPLFNSFVLALAVFSTSSRLVLADPIDWVSVSYVLRQSKASAAERAVTADAQDSIARGAALTAKNGPWSVTNSKVAVAPSRDPHDYLSWAPYHWPNCNWCSNGKKSIATNSTTDPTDNPNELAPEGQDDSGYQAPSLDPGDVLSRSGDDTNGLFPRAVQAPLSADTILSGVPSETALPSSTSTPTKTLTSTTATTTSEPITAPGSSEPDATESPSFATAHGNPRPKSSCTPSPTKSLAPSATWTTCPYVVRDGKVNPDVRNLNGPKAITGVTQSVLFNALSFALTKSADASQNVARFIDVFFINSATKMNPNMNWGQIVRGPGKAGQEGTFTGVLDSRGIVKIVNAIRIVKAAKSPDWTPQRDLAMLDWMNAYVNWFDTSPIGQKLAAKANNHLTFFVTQLAATRMLQGNTNGAITALRDFFSRQFLDQIAASGEQPFEAVRTRPFHYRCFNLEALIANVKIGDELGLDLWSARSKYGATIQTAVDYTMSVDPKGEDVTELAPHVAAIAAAYGDPTGKYAAFLQKAQANFAKSPFWFYDQKSAFSNSPASRIGKRSSRIWAGVKARTPAIAARFTCPRVFDEYGPEIELEDGLFVGCEELKPLYCPLNSC